MTTRILPREEWSRLAGTEVEAIAARLPANCGDVLVVEDDGAIVATWALIPMLHAEGLYIAPSHRGRFGVVMRLLRGMRALAGVESVVTGAVTADVAGFIERLGGTPLPGQAFVLPLTRG